LFDSVVTFGILACNTDAKMQTSITCTLETWVYVQAV